MGFFSLALLIILVWYLFVHRENENRTKAYKKAFEDIKEYHEQAAYQMLAVDKKEGEK